jgi:hypothetical protein
MPLRSTFTAELLKPWLPNIVVVEAVGARTRFRVRLAGTAVVGFAGRDFTDNFLDDVISPEQYNATVASHPRAIGAAPGHAVQQRWRTDRPLRRRVVSLSAGKPLASCVNARRATPTAW